VKRRIYQLLAVVTFVGAASASAAPRTLANGAPAPGNTVAKGESYASPVKRAATALRSARTELAAALAEEKTAAAALAAEPRTLANGAPACGNTGGKSTTCTTERSDSEWKARVQRLVQAGVAVRAAQARVATLTKQRAKLAAGDSQLASNEP